MSLALAVGRPTLPRGGRLAALVAVPAAIAVAGLVVSSSSYAAYSATTQSSANSWASGSVALADDDAGAAAFNVTNARPGATASRCLVVTSTGSLPAQVKVYGARTTSTAGLAAYVDLTLTQGTGGSSGSCAGFTPLAGGGELYRGSLATFAAGHTGFSDGLGGWAPTGSGTESRTYRIAYAVAADAPNATMGGTAGTDLVFEAQNT